MMSQLPNIHTSNGTKVPYLLPIVQCWGSDTSRTLSQLLTVVECALRQGVSAFSGIHSHRISMRQFRNIIIDLFDFLIYSSIEINLPAAKHKCLWICYGNWHGVTLVASGTLKAGSSGWWSWSMVHDYRSSWGSPTGTRKVRLHCGTDMLTMARISDMEPYPAAWGFVELARRCQSKVQRESSQNPGAPIIPRTAKAQWYGAL